MRHIFLRQWNGVSLFLDNSCMPAPDMSLYTDAQGTIGYGAYDHGQRFLGAWPTNMEYHIEVDTSIAHKELVPIVLAAECWAKQWTSKRILFFCDKQAAVAILNKGRSSPQFENGH